MAEIGIGIVGGGYMGKAHSVAMSAVGAVFNTTLRPRLEMVAATSDASAERHRQALGFARATPDWRVLVGDRAVEAIVIASPQDTHRAIAEAAFALGKPVFCEKPLADTLEDARAMVSAAEASGVVNMVGFNYIRTPASCWRRAQLARSPGFAASIPRISSPTPMSRTTGAATASPTATWAISPRIRSTPPSR